MGSTIIKRQKQEDYLSDADYIRFIKDPSISKRDRDTAVYDLYTKYLPLIHKMAHKFNLSKEDSEDYAAEAFFVVLNVIEYTDVTKIDDNYSFAYFLRFQLLNKGIQGVKKSVRREKKAGTTISWDAIVEGGNFRPDEMVIHEDEAFAESEVYSDMTHVRNIVKELPEGELSKRDRAIVLRLLDGYNHREVGEEFGLSQQRIMKIKKQSVDLLMEYV